MGSKLKNSYVTLLYIGFFILFFIISIAVFTYWRDWEKNATDQYLSMLSNDMSKTIIGLSGAFVPAINNVRFLASSGLSVDAFTKSGSKGVNFAVDFLSAESFYFKFRLIDRSGMEIIHLRRMDDGEILIIDGEDLQDKNNREYFKNSINLRKGEVYVSPFNLNVEYGKIEVPHIPVIRFASPVFDHNGTSLGIHVITYNGQIILDILKNLLPNTRATDNFDNMLLDEEGGYLYRPRRESDQFAFLFDSKRVFQTDFPDIWPTVKEGKKAIVVSEQDVFLIEKFWPLAQYASLAKTAGKNSEGSRAMEQYSWTLVVRVPGEMMEEHISPLRVRVWSVWAGAEILLIMLAMVLGKSLNRRYADFVNTSLEQQSQIMFYELQSISFTDISLSEKLNAFLELLLNFHWLKNSRGAILYLPDRHNGEPRVAALVETVPGLFTGCAANSSSCPCRQVCCSGKTFPDFSISHPGQDVLNSVGDTHCQITLLARHAGVVEGALGVNLDEQSKSNKAIAPFLNSVARVLAEMIFRDRTQQELARLHIALNQSPASVVITDTDGIIEYVNLKFTQVTGYSESEAKGQTPRFLKSGKTPPHLYTEMWEAILAGSEWNGELYNKKKDGSFYWESVSVSPLRISDGKITHFIAVKEDITRRKLEAEEKLTLERQLRQAQKMDALGHLTGGIAHDFNNILVSVKGYAELALVRFATDETSKLHNYLQNIVTASNRARDLIAQMLAFGRGQETEAQRVAVEPIIKEVVKMVRASFPSSISITVFCEKEVGDIYIDPVQLHQVILNLLVNARDAIQGKGRLDVRLARVLTGEPMDCHSCHTFFHTAGMIMLSVKDDGVGIPREILDRIFQPFYTTKEVGKGSGMGLSVVHGILHTHGGHVHVSSLPNQNTEFRIFFRPYEAIVEKAVKRDKKLLSSNSLAMEGRLLVVDDEDSVGSVLKEVLEGYGLSVMVSNDSLAALALVKADPHRFDGIITDMTMPNLTGKELAVAVLALNPTMPIIICTGYSRELDEIEAKKLGVRYFLQKPVDMEKLITCLRTVLNPG